MTTVNILARHMPPKVDRPITVRHPISSARKIPTTEPVAPNTGHATF
jgi:hypothetical protein